MDRPITYPQVELNMDILAKLQSFVQWVQLRLFQEASSCFEEFLRGHEHHFCVFVEYTEMLLRQSSYAKFETTVNNFQLKALPQCQGTDRVDLEHLLRLMKALADTCLRGITQENLNEALKFWDDMKSTYSANPHRGLSIIQVHAIEMYMLIVMTASFSKQLAVPSQNFDVPFQLPRMQCSCFGCWYKYLITKDLHSEALKCQSIVLPSRIDEASMQKFMRLDLIAAVALQDEATNMAEWKAVVALATSNQICDHLLWYQPTRLLLTEAYLDVSKFFKEMLSRNGNLHGIERSGLLLQVDHLEGIVSYRLSNPRSNLQ
ncbi:hypothetical protein MAJ_11122, partial [Metarhizium majus ARSEF 297]